MRKTRITTGAIVLSVGLVMAAAVPALAEGSFTSSITGAHVGFGSRTWTDRNVDSTNGYVQFRACNYRTNINVMHQYTVTPDVEVARKEMYCANSVDTLYFGDRAAGDYHFSVNTVNGAGDNSYALSVNYVTVAY